MKKWLFFILCLCYWTLNAQYIDTKLLTANNGLLSNNVQAAFIDHNQNLWLGSRAGLMVKNGATFNTVPQAIKHKFNNITSILQDKQQNIWCASYGLGVLYFNDKKSMLFTENLGLINNTVRTLYHFKNNIYVGTLNGVSIINTNNFKITNPKFVQNANYTFCITSFFEYQSKIYATVLNDGIYEVTTNKLIKVSNIKKIFSSIVYNNTIYVGTQNNLYQLHPTNFNIQQTFNVNNVHQFLNINNQLYMVASGVFENSGGIFQLTNHKIIDKTKELKITVTDLMCLTYDKKNNFIYAGSLTNGLVQINCNAPVYHQNNVGAVQTMNVANGKQFVFHENGFSIFSNSKIEKNISLQAFKNFQEKSNSKYKKHAVIQNHFYPIDYQTTAKKIIFYSSQIHQNYIWAASNIGMFQLDLNGNLISYHPIHVFYFTFFKNDLITAVPYAGVRVFKDIHSMKYNYWHDWKNPDIPAEIVAIAQTNNAVYFASAITGLYEFKDGKFKSFLNNKSFTEAKLKRICTTQNNELVVVTDFNDVYYLDVSSPKIKIKKHISHIQIKGNSTNFVQQIESVLYIGTNAGLNVFSNNTYFFIDKAQGFTSNNSNMATTYLSSLYIATQNGWYQLNNSYFFNKNVKKDAVQIKSISVNNKPFAFNNLQKSLKLAATENTIQIHFSEINAKYPDKLHYKFRLKPTENWQSLSNNQQIDLNYLNHGNYNVQLQINNQDTGNTTVQNLLVITIKPPFYYTWPFIGAVIFCFVCLMFFVYKIRVKFLQQKQKSELAVMELKNEQEKKELLFDKQLADVKLQALKSQMNSHFLFNVLSSIQYFILCKDVDQALYYLERFSNLIRTTLDYSDKKNISLYQEITYLQHYLEIENLRAENEIKLKITSTTDLTQIQIAPLLLQPFIENAIVHAFPPTITNPVIEILVENEAETFKITIIDNGIGYQQKSTSSHQSKGISIVQKRLNLTQKSLQKPVEIQSNANGTKVILYL